MTYILILVTSATLFIGNDDVKVSEYSSKEACEVALSLAKDEWATKNDKSHCISVEEYKKKISMKDELDTLKKKLRNLEDH